MKFLSSPGIVTEPISSNVDSLSENVQEKTQRVVSYRWFREPFFQVCTSTIDVGEVGMASGAEGSSEGK